MCCRMRKPNRGFFRRNGWVWTRIAKGPGEGLSWPMWEPGVDGNNYGLPAGSSTPNNNGEWTMIGEEGSQGL